MSVRLLPPNTDLAPIAAIHACCFAEAWDTRALSELLATPGTFALSSDDGFILARAAAGEAEILTLAVSPAARRHGLGRAPWSQKLRVMRNNWVQPPYSWKLPFRTSLPARSTPASALQKPDAAKGIMPRPGAAPEDALILRSNLPLSPLGKTAPAG